MNHPHSVYTSIILSSVHVNRLFLCPRLVPSSRVAGTADHFFAPFFPVCCQPISARQSLSSCLLHACFPRRFSLPLLRGISATSTLLSYLFLLPHTWPYHLRHFSIIFFLTTLLLLFSSDVCHPHIHLISFTSSHASRPLVVAQISAPYDTT